MSWETWEFNRDMQRLYAKADMITKYVRGFCYYFHNPTTHYATPVCYRVDCKLRMHDAEAYLRARFMLRVGNGEIWSSIPAHRTDVVVLRPESEYEAGYLALKMGSKCERAVAYGARVADLLFTEHVEAKANAWLAFSIMKMGELLRNDGINYYVVNTTPTHSWKAMTVLVKRL